MRQWRAIAKLCSGLAVLSLLFNIALPAEMAGRLEAYSFVRKTVKLLMLIGAGLTLFVLRRGPQRLVPRAPR